MWMDDRLAATGLRFLWRIQNISWTQYLLQMKRFTEEQDSKDNYWTQQEDDSCNSQDIYWETSETKKKLYRRKLRKTQGRQRIECISSFNHQPMTQLLTATNDKNVCPRGSWSLMSPDTTHVLKNMSLWCWKMLTDVLKTTYLMGYTRQRIPSKVCKEIMVTVPRSLL